MKFQLLSLSFLLFSNLLLSQKNDVKIDLITQNKGIIHISHYYKNLQSNDELFIFPMIVPGMYEESNFGNYISEFKAIYENGDTLLPKKKNVNAYTLENPTQIKQVSYSVQHTALESQMTSSVFNPGGTYFNDSAYFLLNFHGIVGYFENHQNNPYEIWIEKGKTIGIGALPIIRNAEHDILTAESYDQLADSPFLYSAYATQDTTSFFVNDMLVQIAVYSDNKQINAAFLKSSVQKIVSEAATNSLLDSYLPEKYCFLFCFEKRNSLFQGALEHKSSSVYSYNSDTTGLINNLSETISHEFFHILTPLNLHSNLITPYNFYNPKTFSKHLWLYEGITEYISFKNNLAAGLINPNEFFLMLNRKKSSTKYYKKNSMLKCSQNVLTRKSQNYYGNYYEKGALIGFYLDYLIAKNSNGTENISNLLAYLLENYGKNKPFKEDEIIPLITAQFESTKVCFKNCVTGKSNVPMDEILAELAVTYGSSTDSIYYDYWSYGFRGMSYSHKDGYFSAKKSRLNKETGLKKVKIYSVNGIPSNELSFMDFYKHDSLPITLEINDSPEKKKVELIPNRNEGYYHPKVTIFPKEASEQMLLIQSILRF